MVITFALHRVITLVRAACHKGHIGNFKISKIRLVTIVQRIFNAHLPRASVCTKSHRANISPNVYNVTGNPLFQKHLCHHFNSVSLGYCTNVKAHLGVGKKNSPRFFINNQIFYVSMCRRFIQHIHWWESSRSRIIHSFATVLVPDAKHASHCHVHFSARFLIHFNRVKKHINYSAIHLNHPVSSVFQLIDAAKIFKPVIPLINIKKPVIFRKLDKYLGSDRIKIPAV